MMRREVYIICTLMTICLIRRSINARKDMISSFVEPTAVGKNRYLYNKDMKIDFQTAA